MSNGKTDNFGTGVFLAMGKGKADCKYSSTLLLKGASYSFDCFIYSVKDITAAQTGQRKRSSMCGESHSISM